MKKQKTINPITILFLRGRGRGLLIKFEIKSQDFRIV
jgi:hypothetical protein